MNCLFIMDLVFEIFIKVGPRGRNSSPDDFRFLNNWTVLIKINFETLTVGAISLVAQTLGFLTPLPRMKGLGVSVSVWGLEINAENNNKKILGKRIFLVFVYKIFWDGQIMIVYNANIKIR